MAYLIRLKKGVLSGINLLQRFALLLLVLLLLLSQNVFPNTYYISPDGLSSNPGTFAEPFAELRDFGNIATAGDTCYVRGGNIMRKNEDINITANGSEGNPICLFAYPGETPIIDGTFVTTVGFDGLLRLYYSSWWHIKGISFANANANWTAGLNLKNCRNIIIENCKFYNNHFTGMMIENIAENIQVINCDSYNNVDDNYDNPDQNYQHADGFQYYPPQDTRSNILYRGCRAWNNSDDGWDFFFAPEHSIIMEDCWAFRNGYDDSGGGLGDGNGFKLGGPLSHASINTTGGHKLTRCVAWGNKWCGFNENTASPSAYTIYNCSAYDNHGWAEYDFDAGKHFDVTHVIRNCFTYKTHPVAVKESDNQYNSWNLGIEISNSDFISLDDTGLDGPRNSDHSLPETNFLHLASGSKLIDKGTDVGLSFSGDSPDLGAFEFIGPTTINEFNNMHNHENSSKIKNYQNYPNPFNITTMISFTLLKTSTVKLIIYNLIGEKVATLLNKKLTNGLHNINFDASALPSGLYIYRLQVNNFSNSKKMILLK